MNPNSSNIWLPLIESAGLPVPKTIVVPYSHRGCVCLFDGEDSAEFDRLVAAAVTAAQQIGFPVFIRTDLSSAKHSGARAFRANAAENVGQCLLDTLEDNEMKFWMEREGPTAFLVRQHLDLPAPFTAFRGLPISREFRFFADADRVICRHAYWPADAVGEHIDGERPDNWESLLAAIQVVPEEAVILDEMAIAAARVCGGRWSVDFAQDLDRRWWLLDMATMDASYHWPGCPNGKGGDLK